MPDDIAKLGLEITSDDVLKAMRRLDKLEDQSKKNERQNDRLKKSNKSLNKSFGALQAGIGALSVAGLVYASSRALSLADDFAILQSRIENATRTTGDYLEVSRELNRVSALTGSALKDTVDVFQRLTQSRQDLGATNDELLTLTELVQKLGVVSGASRAAMSAGLMQFGQGLSAGVFRAEEFNSIVENLPAVAKALGDALEKSPGELRKTVLEGKLLSKDVMQALLSQATDINKQFDAMPISMQRASASLSNSFSRFLGTLDKAAQGTGNIAKVMSAITESLDNWSDRIGESELDELMRRRAAAMAAYQQHINSGATATSDLITGLKSAIDELDAKIIDANKLLSKETEEKALAKVKVETGTKATEDTGESTEEAELEKLREKYATEYELLQEKIIAEQMLIDEALVAGELREEEHEQLMTRINEKYARAREKLAKDEARGRERAIGSMMNNLVSLMNTGSKKLFQIGKIAAIAQATVDTYKGAQSAFADTPGPIWLKVAAGIAATAAGVARVASIAGTSFGGGGPSPATTASTTGGQPVTGSLPPPPSTPTATAQEVNITIVGRTTAEDTRDLIDELNDQLGDNVQLNVTMLPA